ncbi:MAG: hypothetical protein KQ78_00030 [Candidatus Izimaplasma bacterium HR2]|nr:MAG: hypothetical protein KQ78_00030 [Candidatus Izimaplasma bacterium HR2]
MSTKIYNAYRIKEEYSIEDVMEKIKKQKSYTRVKLLIFFLIIGIVLK